MKKSIILILMLFCLSGCSAVYNLEIKNKKFNEDISIMIDNEDSGSLSYFKDEKFYAVMDGASSFKAYKKIIKTKKDQTNVKLSHSYKSLDYLKSTALASCFSAYNVISEKGYYIISTSKGLNCATEENTVLLDNLKVVIRTNHKVVESNADAVNKYIYTWEFNKDNYKDASIYMKIYKNKYIFNYNNEFFKKLGLYVGIPVGVIAVILLFFLRIKQKQKKANKV